MGTIRRPDESATAARTTAEATTTTTGATKTTSAHDWATKRIRTTIGNQISTGFITEDQKKLKPKIDKLNHKSYI